MTKENTSELIRWCICFTVIMTVISIHSRCYHEEQAAEQNIINENKESYKVLTQRRNAAAGELNAREQELQDSLKVWRERAK